MEAKVEKANFEKLNKFLKSLQGSGDYVVRVGIMGRKNTRTDNSGMTNADIGFIHEFGRPATKGHPTIPERSFLRMPILTKSNVIIKETQQYIDVEKPENLTTPGILGMLGKMCERAILDAFDSGGFGKWEGNRPYTIRKKGSSQPLIDHGFLRKSITSEVVSV